MPRLLSRLALSLTLLITLLIGLTRTLAYDESYSQALRDFLRTDGPCRDLCFMGLDNQLDADRVIRILQQHDWIGAISVDESPRGNRTITWEWSGQQPAFIHSDDPGSVLIIYENVNYPQVASLQLGGSFTLGDLWLALGVPDGGFVWQEHFASYNEGGLLLRMELDCRHFWRTAGTLSTGSDNTLASYDLKEFRHNVCVQEWDQD